MCVPVLGNIRANLCATTLRLATFCESLDNMFESTICYECKNTRLYDLLNNCVRDGVKLAGAEPAGAPTFGARRNSHCYTRLRVRTVVHMFVVPVSRMVLCGWYSKQAGLKLLFVPLAGCVGGLRRRQRRSNKSSLGQPIRA